MPLDLLLLLLDCLAEDPSDITFSGLLCLITRFHLVVYQSGCHLMQINIKLWLRVPKTIGKFITSHIKKCISGLTLRLFDAMTYRAIKNPVLLDLRFCLRWLPEDHSMAAVVPDVTARHSSDQHQKRAYLS